MAYASMVARSYAASADVKEAIRQTLEDGTVLINPPAIVAAMTSDGNSAVGSLTRADCANESDPGPLTATISLAAFPVLSGGITAAFRMTASTETSPHKTSPPIDRPLETASRDAQRRSSSSATMVKPPRSWACPPQHLTSVMEDAWYKILFVVQDALVKSTNAFFHERLGYRYCLVPMTTNAISSPMGLGSDSEPVPVLLLGQPTYLADSMQFGLEYYLRIDESQPGVYYVSNSFRGEDADAMHLNQFVHVECELPGDFEKGVSVAERYITHLVSGFIRDHTELISQVAGSTDHLLALLQHYAFNGNSFPQISVDDALKLPTMDQDCWKYVTTDPTQGRALTRRGELKLIEYFHGAVWLVEMDHLSVPFYQAFAGQGKAKARCGDLLLGNGEVLGLGERHGTAEDVQEALDMHATPSDAYAWYMEMKRQRPLQSTGWGMGVERFLAWIFQHDDIRDLAIVPRMTGVDLAP